MNNESTPFSRTFDTLENLADAISEVVGCPITIEDPEHRLLAYSSHNQNATDEARLATIMGRRVPEKVINGLWKAGVIQALAESERPIRIPAMQAIGLGDRVAIAIRKGHELLGYIWALESEQSLTDAQMSALEQAVTAASTKLIQLKARKKKEQEAHEEFFWRLLMGNFKSDEAIQAKAKELKVVLPAVFSIVIFQFEADIREKIREQMSYIVTTTQRVRVVFSVTDRTQLIVLVTSPSKAQLMHEDCVAFIMATIAQMKERFGAHPFIGGSGTIYAAPHQVRNSYQEALTVVEMKQQFPDETSAIYDYQHLGFYRFLPAIIEKRLQETARNYTLDRLRAYDNQHHASLLQTLEVFLNYDGNMKEAAEALHVHMNTLTYRLKRICEIGDIDLKNAHQKFSLFLDLKLDKLLP